MRYRSEFKHGITNPKAAAHCCSVKTLFWKILQNSQENTGVSFLIKLQASGLRHAALLKNNLVWSGITNSIAFCVWFFQKKYFWSNIIAWLPFVLEIFVNMCCNCLLARLWRHKFEINLYNQAIFRHDRKLKTKN